MVNALVSSGFGLLVLAIMHAAFPRYFRWARELRRLSLVNAEMMRVHTLFIAVVVAGMGVLCITSAELLTTTELGRRICIGFAAFWGLRFVIQFIGYSSELWRGKHFETVVHVVFSLLWVWLTLLFSWVAVSA